MYKISVPLMASTINDGNIEKYLSLCKECGATRIFLALEDNTIEPSLAQKIAFFKNHGFEVGVWFSTIGHGFALEHTDDNTPQSEFSEIIDIEGRKRPFANCPLDEKFCDFISRFVADIAKLGPDIVMLDDDFRLSQHGEHLCCACQLHMDSISEILGEKVTREQIRPHIISGKPNKYRDAWLKAQNDSLIRLAKRIRAEVDKETPDVCICNCTAFCLWNVDGVDVPQIARILGGKHQPILRPTGAPYWATGLRRKYPLIAVFEIARMLASFVENEGFDLMSEGDVYPRPRYTCPASYLELYDVVTRISGGYNGILKYMFDYVAGPDFETGYLKLHQAKKEYTQKTSELFDGGANVGVRVVVKPHTAKNADHDLSAPKIYSPVPLDGTMLGQCGIPTVYKGRGICNSVFGENARDLDLSELKNGTILDAVSAVILTQRGVDVGLKSVGELKNKNIGFLCTKDTEFKSLITRGQVRVLDADINDNAEPMLFSVESAVNKTFAYRYENLNGERFLVFLFDGASIYDYSNAIALSGITKNYATQEVLIDTVPWLARKPLPVYCSKNPELYVMCKQDTDSMGVALFNCFEDEILNPVVTLDRCYSDIECVNCEAELDGTKVVLKSTLHAFSYVAFRVYMKK